MSHTNEKRDSQEYPEKDHVGYELGHVVASTEALSAEEDRRILRKIDLK